MSLLNRLTAILRLNNTQFRRKAKESKRDVRAVGTESQRTARSGSAGFLAMAGAVSAIGAAAVATLSRLTAMSNAIAKAADDAARAQQQVSGGLAQRLGGEDVTRVRQLFGQTAQQFNQRVTGLAAQFDQTPEQVIAALEPIGARIQDPALRQGAIETALTIGATRGVFGEAAGLLPPLLIEQFGAQTTADIQAGVAGIGSAAEVSAIPAPAFGNVLTTIAPTFTQAGVGLRGQVGLISGLAPFFPTRPREIGTQLLRLGELRLRKTPFLEGILQAQGVDPKTQNAEEILEGIIGYVRGGGDIQRLQTEGMVPFEVIRGVIATATGAFAAARQKGLEAFDASGFGEERRRLAEALATPESRLRRAEIVGRGPEQTFGEPGTQVEAVDILTRLQGITAGGIGREERLTFQRTVSEAQAGLIDEDPAFTAEQALELQTLNALFPQVLARLIAIQFARGPGAGLSAHHINRIRFTSREANKTHFVGEQVKELPAFNVAMRDAIQFIRQVALRQPIRAERLGGEKVVVTPGEAGQAAAGGDVVGGVNLGTLSGVSAQQVIINNNTPANPGGRTGGSAPKADPK